MPECHNTEEKVSPAFLPVISLVNLASAFQHHGQSGTTGFAFKTYNLPILLL
jgi:hypothetical protein